MSDLISLHTFDYNNAQYLKDTYIPYAAPGVIIAVLSLLGFIGLLLGRCCFGCCGGSAKDKQRYFKESEIRFSRIMMIGVMVIVAAGFVIGFIGNGSVSKNVSNVTDRVVVGVTDGATAIADITTNMAKSGYSDTNTRTLADMNDSIQKVNDQMVDFKDEVKKLDKIRSWAMIGTFALPLLGLLFVIGGMIARNRGLVWLFLLITFISLIINWIMFAGHLTLRRAVTDVCKDLTTFNSAPTKYEILHIVKCYGAAEVANTRSAAVDQGVTLQTDINNEVDNVNSQLSSSDPPCPSLNLDFVGLRSTDESKLNTAIEDAKKQTKALADYKPPASAPQTQNSFNNIAAWNTQLGFVLVVLPTINDVQVCKMISSFVKDISVFLCDDFTKSLLMISIGHAIVGGGLIFGVFFGVQGMNRFAQKGSNMTAVPAKGTAYVAPVVAPQYKPFSGVAPADDNAGDRKSDPWGRQPSKKPASTMPKSDSQLSLGGAGGASTPRFDYEEEYERRPSKKTSGAAGGGSKSGGFLASILSGKKGSDENKYEDNYDAYDLPGTYGGGGGGYEDYGSGGGGGYDDYGGFDDYKDSSV